MMPLSCAHCGGELRPTAITAAGATYACPCGRTTWTKLVEGKITYTDAEGKAFDPQPVREEL